MNTSTSSVRETSVLENHALSELFCTPDADVTFISSNNILFKLHGTHLTTLTSTGFARTSEDLSVSEPVRLPEHSTVLEILFQFIEPPTESRHFRQPSIVGLDSTVFFGVSEAAEKYVVYGAMNVCITRMQQIIVEYPLEVLNHCAKHGYPELGDEAAEHSLLADLSQVAVKLTVPGLLSQWLIYYSAWSKYGKEYKLRFQGYSPKNCAIWLHLQLQYSRQLDRDPTLLHKRPVYKSGCQLGQSGRVMCS